MSIVTDSSFYKICKCFPSELLCHIQKEVIKSFNISELLKLLKTHQWISSIKTVLQQSCFHISHYQDIHKVENTFFQIQLVKGKFDIKSHEFQEFVRLMGYYSIKPLKLCFKTFDWNNNTQTCTLVIPKMITENGYLKELVMSSSKISTGFVDSVSLNKLFYQNLACKFVEFTLATSSFPCPSDLENFRLTKFARLERLIIDVKNKSGIDWCIKLLTFDDFTEHCYLDNLTHLKQVVIHLSDRIQSSSPEIESILLKLSCSISEFEKRYQIPVNVESNKPFYCIKRPTLLNGVEIEPLVIKYLNDNITSISINSNSGFQIANNEPNRYDHISWISDCSRLSSLTLTPSSGIIIPLESFIAIANTLKHLEVKKYRFEDPQINNIPWNKLRMLSSLKITNCSSQHNLISNFSTLSNIRFLTISNFTVTNNETSQILLPQGLSYFNWDGSKFPIFLAPYPQFLIEANFTDLAASSIIQTLPFSPINLTITSRWNLFNSSSNFNSLIDTHNLELNVPLNNTFDLNILPPNIKSLKINASKVQQLLNYFPRTLTILDVDLGSYNLDLLSKASSCWSPHLGCLNITYTGAQTLDFTLLNIDGIHSIILNDQLGSLKSIKTGEIPNSMNLFKIKRPLIGNNSSLYLTVPEITQKLMDLEIMMNCDEIYEVQNEAF